MIHEVSEAFVEGNHPELSSTPEALGEFELHLERGELRRLAEGRIALFCGDGMQVEVFDKRARRRSLLLKGFQGCGLALCIFHNFILYSKIRVVKFAFFPEVVSLFGTRRAPCLRFETPYMAPSR